MIVKEHRKPLKSKKAKFPRLTKILADVGYHGSLKDRVKDKFGWVLEIVLRSDQCPSKFQVLPKRRMVERSFSWLENFRRLTMDYEFKADTAEAMVQLAFIQIMLNRIIE
ncbi:transposase [Porphyromonas pogonae]|uniref:transposase n=1 Tax=Porphyromonas pogonae TaxID=867595 RepID=UPI002E791169|nr:transposase [Porphyromonas pogonae]